MKALYLLLVALAAHTLCAAQNWQCLQPARNVYFTNNLHYLRGMRIDSVRAVGADLVYYPYHSPRGRFHVYASNEPPIAPLDTAGGSWLGRRIVQRQDGTTWFDNIWGDTVILMPQAALGASWSFYTDTGARYYEATVTALGQAVVDGAPDSVKTIRIRAKIAGNIVADSLNGFEIVLSKNHGFVQVPDLVAFPYRRPGDAFNPQFPAYFDYYLEMIRRKAADARSYIFKRTDLHSPTYGEMYDFRSGDVFQVAHYGGVFGYTYLFTETDSVIRRDLVPGGIRYVRVIDNRRQPDTLVIPAPDRPVIDTALMPEEWPNATITYYDDADTAFCTTATMCALERTGILLGGGAVNTFEPPYSLLKLKAGFGELDHFHCLDASCGDDQLSYVQKNGLPPCGSYTPLGIGPIATTASGLRLWPVPAHEVLYLDLTGFGSTAQVAVFNLQGRVVYTCAAPARVLQLPLTGLPGGTYFVKVQGGSRSAHSRFQVIR